MRGKLVMAYTPHAAAANILYDVGATDSTGARWVVVVVGVGGCGGCGGVGWSPFGQP